MNGIEIGNILRAWILRVNEAEKLPEGITALNFGLYEPYGVELTGSLIYDPEDDDWACEEDFQPIERNCPELNIDDRENWEEVLDAIVFILKSIISEQEGIPLLSVSHITAGFSDGDLRIVK